MSLKVLAPLALLATVTLSLAGCGGDDGDTLTIYSGREEELVGPLLEQFHDATGINIRVRYGGTSLLAATILEEGDDSPADVFFAQDAGALGALAKKDRLEQLPDSILSKVAPAYRSDAGLWVGLSGRARVVVYNPDRLTEADLPASILDFTDPKWKGRIAWAPQNGSFQAFVTGLRLLVGEDGARAWLEGIKANDPVDFPNNVSIVDAVAKGELDVGFVNHYYVLQLIAERGEDLAARNFYQAGGDPGALVNVAGAGILASSDNQDLALRFLEFMLSAEAQAYFAEETFEYPLVEGVPADPRLLPLTELEPPEIDLSNLDDLEGTLDLLREAGILQ